MAAVLARNPGIDAMLAAVDAARAQIEAAGALPNPMLSYQMAPATLGAQGMPFGQSLQLSQSFPWPGTLYLRRAAAEAEARSTAQRLADLRLQLAAQTRSAYAEWAYVHRALAINEENQTIVARLRQAAEAAYASAQASQQDVLQAQVELTRLQNQRLKLERRQRIVQANINGLLNQPPQTPLPPPRALPPPRDVPAFDALRTKALARYPALKSLAAQVAASRASVKLAKKNAYPSFTVMAGYNSMWAQPELRPMIGGSITIPFGGDEAAEINAAQAKLRQSRAHLANRRSQVLSNLAQTYAKAEQARLTVRLYTEKLLPLAKQNLRAALNDYRNGTGEFLTLVSAEQQLLMARLKRTQARANFFTRLAELHYVTGGALFTAVPSTLKQESLP
ncbi:MAG: TolC family protein [Salinisphaera sp.]|nr:TolC family protein [Salinisphaera sp.]